MTLYAPQPIDTTGVNLPDSLQPLIENLARNVHDVWARNRIAEGWRCAPRKDGDAKTTPLLVPYEELPESEKHYDRATAIETLKAIIVLGYTIAA